MKKQIVAIIVISISTTFTVNTANAQVVLQSQKCKMGLELEYGLEYKGFYNPIWKDNINIKIKEVSKILDKYFNIKDLFKNINNVLAISCNVPKSQQYEKKYINEKVKKIFDEFYKGYNNTLNSWYALIPILNARLNGGNVSKESWNYHIKDFIGKLKKAANLYNQLKDIKVAEVIFTPDSHYTIQNYNYTTINYKNMLVKVNGQIKDLNYFQLMYNKDLHSKFKPYKPFYIIYKGDLIKGYKLISVFNQKD